MIIDIPFELNEIVYVIEEETVLDKKFGFLQIIA